MLLSNPVVPRVTWDKSTPSHRPNKEQEALRAAFWTDGKSCEGESQKQRGLSKNKCKCYMGRQEHISES